MRGTLENLMLKNYFTYFNKVSYIIINKGLLNKTWHFDFFEIVLSLMKELERAL